MNLSEKQIQLLKWLGATILVIALGLLGYNYPLPQPPTSAGSVTDDEITALGITNFLGLQVDSNADTTTALTVNQTGTGSIVDFQDGGTSVWAIADGGALTQSGDIVVQGTTPQITIGDAGAEDTALVFDGNAQDYYIALDDSADDLIVGLGSAVGTTGILYFDENQDVGIGGASAGAKLDVTGNQLIDGAADEIQITVQGYTTQTTSLLVAEQSDGTDVATLSNAGALDIASTFNYGTNDLYPLGHSSSGLQAVYGTDTITGTLAVTHGLTTVTFCLATLGEDPTAGAGDAAHVSTAVAANVCTIKAWQDDFVTAASEADVTVHWLVIGTP